MPSLELKSCPNNPDQAAKDLLIGCLVIQCKGLQGKKVFIKPRSDALANMKVLASADHGKMIISHLFMYRDPIPNMKSIATMFNMAQKTAFLLKEWVMPFLMMIAEETGELGGKRLCCK